MKISAAWLAAAALGFTAVGAQQPAQTLRLLDETAAQWATAQPATLFVARRIVTGNPDRPTATAVAVAQGRVLSVGSLEAVKADMGDMPFDVDRRFANKVVVPGFIDANADPVLAALALGTTIIAADDWSIAGRGARVARNRKQYLVQVSQAAARVAKPGGVLFTWGYDPAIHGEIGRTDLDHASPRRAVVLWSRAGDALVFNSAALRRYAVAGAIPDEARFSGSVQSAVIPFVARDLFTPRRFADGMAALRRWLPAQGITTLVQPGALKAIAPQHLIAAALDDPSTPFRTFLIADGTAIFAAAAKSGELDELLARTQRYETFGRGRVQWLSGQVAIRCESRKDFEAAFRMYWDAAYQVHAVAGDECDGATILQMLRDRMAAGRRPDHRLTVALLPNFTAQAPAELASMGAIVSTLRPGLPAGRLSRSGGLASLTTEPAFAFGREGDVGSIKAGNHADFAILEWDPQLAAGGLDAMRIWGTVLSGRVYPAR